MAVTGITLDRTSLGLTVGGAAVKLTATVLPANASNKSVEWISSNTAVATVEDGVVTPVAAGTATITARTVDGGKTATCVVTVVAATDGFVMFDWDRYAHSHIVGITVEDADMNKDPLAAESLKVHVKSSTESFDLELTESEMTEDGLKPAPDSGVFMALLDLTAPGGEDEVFTTLEAAVGDNIFVEYMDEIAADGNKNVLRSDSAVIIPQTTATISFDYDRYNIGNWITVTVTDPDSDVTDNRDTARVKITSEKDKAGFDLILDETGSNTGVFKADFCTGEETNSEERTIGVNTAGDTITAEYRDFGSANEYISDTVAVEQYIHIDVFAVSELYGFEFESKLIDTEYQYLYGKLYNDAGELESQNVLVFELNKDMERYRTVYDGKLNIAGYAIELFKDQACSDYLLTGTLFVSPMPHITSGNFGGTVYTDTIKIEGYISNYIASEDNSLQIIVNDGELAQIPIADDGSFAADVKLVLGVNNVKLHFDFNYEGMTSGSYRTSRNIKYEIAPDTTAPTLEKVEPAEGPVELTHDETFKLTVDAKDDGELSELEIDHNMENQLPEFSVYADEVNPYGDADSKEEFEAAGVTVTYDAEEQKWEIDFGAAVTNVIVAKRDVKFYVVIKDKAGNQFGSMYGTTPENTFEYTVTQKAAPVAQIGNVKYDTLKEAVAAVQNGQTVKLCANASGDGIKVPSGTNFTLDLGGFTYKIDGQLVGSTGTETNGFQLLRDSNITIKNGAITTTKAKILIQNYSNLTLDNVDLTGVDVTKYVLSNNNGTTTLANGTTITAAGSNVAFDVYYWPKNGYQSVTVEIASNDVVINGKVEYASDGSDNEGFAENAKLIIPAGYNLDAPTGYKWTARDGKQVLININTVAMIGARQYDSLQAAIDAAEDGDTIDVAEGTHDIGKIQLLIAKGITLRGVGAVRPVIRGTAYDIGSYTEPMLKTIANNTDEHETLIENLSFEWVFEDGFVLKGNGNAAMLAGNNVTVRNCEFKGINIPDTQYAAIVSIGQTGGTVGPNVEAYKISFDYNDVDGTVCLVRSAQGKVLEARVTGNNIDPVNMEGIWTYMLSADDILTIADNTITGVPEGFTAIKLMEKVASVNGETDYTDDTISAANNGASVKLNWIAKADTVDSLISAIASAKAGDVIMLAPVKYTITETINVDKAVTIKGADNFGTEIVTTGGNPVFNLSAAATLDGIYISKEDKANQHLVIITANDATVRNSKFVGQYVKGDNEVVRAIVPNAGITGYVISGNYFESVRQPAYLEGAGTVTDNIVKNTRGWVVCVNHDITFTGNSFEGNAVDIAIIANGQTHSDNYTDLAAISEANNGAHVENQLIKATAKNGKLVVEAEGNEYINSIQNAVAAANEGDTIMISAGIFEGFSIIGKEGLKIIGAGADATIIEPETLITSGIAHKYTANMKVSVVVNDSRDIVLLGLTVSGGGLNPDAMVLWNESTGRIENCIITDDTTLDGVQSGQGIAVDGSSGTTKLDIIDTDISGFHKNAVDIIDGNGTTAGSTADITVNMTGGTITGAGKTDVIAQNGIVFWDRAGGTISGSITDVMFKDIYYNGPETSFAIFDNRSNKLRKISIQDCDFDNVEGEKYPILEVEVNGGYTEETPFFGVTRFNSINAAIAGVEAGVTINVAEGKYHEDVVVNKAVTIIGAGADKTRIVATDGNKTALTFAADNATVSGFTITHEYTEDELAEWIFNNNGVIFNQRTTGNILRECTVSLNRNGIYLNNCQGNSIIDNVISNNRTGINMANNVDDTVISGNEIAENWTVGLVYYSLSDKPESQTDFSTVTVEDNTFDGNWYSEILLKDAPLSTGDLDVTDNEFTDDPVTYSTSSNPELNEPAFKDQKPDAEGIGGDAKKPDKDIPTLRIYNCGDVRLIYDEVLTLNVGENERYQTLEAALADARDGDIINICGDISLDDAVVIDKAVLIDGNGYSIDKGLKVTADDVAIQELDITPSEIPGSGDIAGIYITGTGVTITNVVITGTGEGAERGIIGTTGAEFSVEACDISNVMTGIYANALGGEFVTLEALNNTFSDCVAGIGGTENTKLAAIEGNLFENCTEGIGLGAGVTSSVAEDSELIDYLIDENTFESVTDAVKDYRE